MSIDREESLFLTVSENHTRRDYPEYILKMCTPYRRAEGSIAVYEGLMLGGGDKLFGLEVLNLWLRRHRYAAYDMHVLLPIARLCLEYAVRSRLTPERPGIPAMAAQAAQELLDRDPLHWRYSPSGWLTIYWLTRQFPSISNTESSRVLQNFTGFEEVLDLFCRLIEPCKACPDAKSLVEQAVLLYKKVFVRYFAPDHSGNDMPEFELDDDDLWEGKHPDPHEDDPAEPEECQPELKYERATLNPEDGVTLSEEDLAAIPDYLALNFGPSYQTETEKEALESTVCVGIHEERKLLLTQGLPQEAYEEDTDRARSLRACRDRNLDMLEDHRSSAQQGIRSIAQAFQNALNLKSQPEVYRADRGTLVNSLLWKAGRVQDAKLFDKMFRQDESTIVVDLLIDASGSQVGRQSMVALQSYMFSSALSSIHIPHRVMSYCTYGDHTILTRFRDYDDRGDADRNILRYRATSNNRDGLALAAAGCDLLARKEDHRILIVFSDGLPNDMVSGRVRKDTPARYIGEAAIRDTCYQVRALRRQGVHVIGIFLGEDGELENEHLIYGSSFLRIRRAEDFGGTAGKRLCETLLQL